MNVGDVIQAVKIGQNLKGKILEIEGYKNDDGYFKIVQYQCPQSFAFTEDIAGGKEVGFFVGNEHENKAQRKTETDYEKDISNIEGLIYHERFVPFAQRQEVFDAKISGERFWLKIIQKGVQTSQK